MGGVVQGALGTANNLVSGVLGQNNPVSGALGQVGGMVGGAPGMQQGQQGGLMGGKGGGGNPLGGLMGGGGGKGGLGRQMTAPFNQFAQGAARLGNGQNPFGGAAGAGFGSLLGQGGQGGFNWMSPQSAAQQFNPGGQYGGGYAANGRSLMPTNGQQNSSSYNANAATSNNGQSANSQLSPGFYDQYRT